MSSGRDHRITSAHLERSAIVYVRQSSPEQVRGNVESTRIQLGLRQKAIALGWPDPLVIDDDLGVSAGGFADRHGFQTMLTQVALRKVGIILCTDASRLSRNSRDWAHLFELCGYFQTLIADLEQVYDLSHPNDRLVMGIKGTMSEMELVILKTRMRTGVEAKARRGELKFLVPVGYAHDPDGRVVLDPDQRIQAAVRLLFQQFELSASVRQLGMWYRETQTLFPIRKRDQVEWSLPAPRTLYNLLGHPFYAGAYVYGRKPSRIEYVEGRLVRKEGEVLAPEDCRVCIRDHHPAYISWATLLANRVKLDDNRPRWKMMANRGAVRDGLALLSGLLRCGHCGDKIYVNYKRDSAIYYCDGGEEKTTRRCLSFGSKLIDQQVSAELCRALAPTSIEVALKAEESRRARESAALENARLALEAARYQAERAFEQYDLVDPRNRLVADNLEQRLNARLAELNQAELRLKALSKQAEPIAAEQQRRLRQLAEDLPMVWDHPLADPTLKKRILRTAIREVLVVHEAEKQNLAVTIHWHGGAHTRVDVKKRATPVGHKADPELVELVRELARETSDAEIARILNMKKLKTPHGQPWNLERVRGFRRHRQILLGDAARGGGDDLTANEAAEYLGISRNGLLGLERLGAISRRQVTDFAPWRLAKQDLDSRSVRRLVRHLKRFGRLPKGGCPEGQEKLFR
jgi:DNA invertase Pin-like site-specific DNA recombinase